MPGTIRPSVPWCLPVQEAGQQHQQQPKPAHQKQRSSNNRSSSRAAYSRSRAAGRPCGHSCQELPRAGNLCFLTRVSEGTLGLVDYHCRAPFRPSVPWCFPVREVHFFKTICWLKDVVNSCGLQRWQTGAKRCQELSRVGPCVLQCSLTKVSEGTLGPVDYHCRAPFVLQFHGVCPSRRLVSSISSSRSQHTKSSGAATTEVAAEQLTAGAG